MRLYYYHQWQHELGEWSLPLTCLESTKCKPMVILAPDLNRVSVMAAGLWPLVRQHSSFTWIRHCMHLYVNWYLCCCDGYSVNWRWLGNIYFQSWVDNLTWRGDRYADCHLSRLRNILHPHSSNIYQLWSWKDVWSCTPSSDALTVCGPRTVCKNFEYRIPTSALTSFPSVDRICKHALGRRQCHKYSSTLFTLVETTTYKNWWGSDCHLGKVGAGWVEGWGLIVIYLF